MGERVMPDFNNMKDDELLNHLNSQPAAPAQTSNYKDMSDDQLLNHLNGSTQQQPQSQGLLSQYVDFGAGNLAGIGDTVKSYANAANQAMSSVPGQVLNALPIGPPGGFKQLQDTASRVAPVVDQTTSYMRDRASDKGVFDTGRNTGYYTSQYGPAVKAGVDAIGRGLIGKAAMGGNSEETAANYEAMKQAGVQSPSPLSASQNPIGQKTASFLSNFPLVGGKSKYMSQNQQLSQGMQGYADDLSKLPDYQSQYNKVGEATAGKEYSFEKGRQAAINTLSQIQELEKIGAKYPAEVVDRIRRVAEGNPGNFENLKQTTENLSNYLYSKNPLDKVTGDVSRHIKGVTAGMSEDLRGIASNAGVGDVYSQAVQGAKQKVASDYVNNIINKSMASGSTTDVDPSKFTKRVLQDLQSTHSTLKGTLPPEQLDKLNTIVKATQAMEWQLKNFKPSKGPGLIGLAAIGGAGAAGMFGGGVTAATVGAGIKALTSFMNSPAGLKFAQQAANFSFKDPKFLSMLGSAIPGVMNNNGI